MSKPYIIAEVAEGVFYDWKKALIVIDLAEAFYGKMAMPHYISHRIHKYHVNPADWLNFFQIVYLFTSGKIFSSSYIINNYFDALNNDQKKFLDDFKKKFSFEKITPIFC